MQLSYALAIVHVCYFMGSLCFHFLWPHIPGTIGFHVTTFLAVTPLFGGIALAGDAYARCMDMLQDQLSNFNVCSATCQSEGDRKLICRGIQKMFGSLENFNRAVHKNLKDEVEKDLRRQPSMVPSTFIMVAISPGIAFFFGGISCFRNLPLYFRLAHYIFSVTYCFAFFPLMTAMCMGMGSLLTKCASEGNSAIKYTTALLIGALAAPMVCMFGHVAFFWPCAVGSGAFNNVPYAVEWRLQEHHAIPMVLLVATPIWIVAAWAFIPRSKPSAAASHLARRLAVRVADEDVIVRTIWV